jgi:hypothetical protein
VHYSVRCCSHAPCGVFELFRLAIVDGARRRDYSVRSKSAVRDRSNRVLQRAEQSFFNPVDQLGNIDRLSERSVPFDAEAGLRLRFCE